VCSPIYSHIIHEIYCTVYSYFIGEKIDSNSSCNQKSFCYDRRMKTKEEKNAYARQYYADHKLEYSLRAAGNYEKHKDAIRERIRRYQDANPDKVIQWRRKFNSDRAKCNKQKHDWIDENPEAYFANYESYIDQNTQMLRDKANQYRANKPYIHAKSQKKYRDANKDYAKVLRETNNMLQDGTLKKSPCTVCGSVEVMAYHLDRVNPTNIEWMCKEHFWAKKKAFYRERKRLKLGLTS